MPRRKYEDDGWNAGYDNGYPSQDEEPDWWIDDYDDGYNSCRELFEEEEDED